MANLDTNALARTSQLYDRVKRVIPPPEWAVFADDVDAILELKRQRNAVILAHNYQTPEIFHGVADIVGDQQRVKTRPKAWVDRNRGHRTAPCNVGSRNGLGAGTGGGCGGRPKAGPGGIDGPRKSVTRA